MKKRCFNCKQILDKEKFTHAHLCPECAKLEGVRVGKSVEIYHCSGCGLEFSHMRTDPPAKYCSFQCYNDFLNSDDNPRKAGKQKSGTKKYQRGPLHLGYSVPPDALEGHRERCKKSLSSFGEIVKLCNKLHISYGTYQQLVMTGKLEAYMREHGVE